MKAGGASEIARSAVYGTTMRVSRTEIPCGVQGAVACRLLSRMKAGGALEIARSAVCGTTMRAFRTRAPEQGLGRQPQRNPCTAQKMQAGAEPKATITADAVPLEAAVFSGKAL